MNENLTKKGKNTREKILATAEALFLARGFAGTSIDEILAATGISKGAFFYHFKNKSHLARAVVERYAQQDLVLLRQLSQRADQLSDDPLQSMLIFLKLFEEYIEGFQEPPAGCVFAAYVYESQQFDPEIQAFVAQGFRHWGAIYRDRLERILAQYPAKIEVNAAEIAEMLMCVIEGGFVLAKSLEEVSLMVRSLRQIRFYLQLLFIPQG